MQIRLATAIVFATQLRCVAIAADRDPANPPLNDEIDTGWRFFNRHVNRSMCVYRITSLWAVLSSLGEYKTILILVLHYITYI